MQLPGITLAQCRTKFKNLRYAFIKYEENVKTTGAARQSLPTGYDIVASFLLDRPIVHPSTSSSALPGMELLFITINENKCHYFLTFTYQLLSCVHTATISLGEGAVTQKICYIHPHFISVNYCLHVYI